MEEEQRRILEAYDLRRSMARNGYFEYEDQAHLARLYERYRETLKLLKKHGYHPLTNIRVLDIGCGDGNMLRQYIQWGAIPDNLAGVELRPEPVHKAQHLSPNIDVRQGSAEQLPWPDSTFDLVCQHTVFTSILDQVMKQQIASEMVRVLRPGGAVLWYDFMFNNPHNPDVRGISRNEIQSLFPTLQIHLRRVTLAPPIARRIPESTLPMLYPLLSMTSPLCTHYLGLLIRLS